MKITASLGCICVAVYSCVSAYAQAPVPVPVQIVTPAGPATIVIPGQQPAQPGQVPPDQATIAGIVTIKGTKQPVERAVLEIVGPNGATSQMMTSVDGKFEIKGPPGSYRLTVRRRGPNGYVGVPAVKVASIRAKEETKVDVEVSPTAELSGRVLDSRGEPVPGVRVTLLMRAYEVWSTNRIYQNTPFNAQSNDVGEYTIPDVPHDIPFYVYAEPQSSSAAAPADVAADPAARRPVLASTFYPASIDPGGAQAVMLSEGSQREGIDIRMVRTQPYCMKDTVLPTPPTGNYSIMIDPVYIGSGVFNDTGSYRSGRNVLLDAQGKASVCGLWPGDYKFTIQPQGPTNAASYYGMGEFKIVDQDVTRVVVREKTTSEVPGELIVDGALPPDKIPNKVRMDMVGLTVTAGGGSTTSDIPGKFTFGNLRQDRYFLRFFNLPDNWYVQSVMYGNEDITQRFGRFELNNPGAPLKVTLGQKGARIKVKVLDGQSNPVVGSRVILVRNDRNEPAKLAGQLWLSYSDGQGECTSWTLTLEPARATLKPGDYTLLATDLPYNQPADVMDQLWRTLRDSGTKVKLESGVTTEVTIKPVSLR